MCTHEREILLDRPDLAAIVEDAWLSVAERFRSVGLDEFVVMPNHVHGIVGLEGAGAPKLGQLVRAFKSISAIAANRALDRHDSPFWQRNYYERVIRREAELEAVREYIRSNPLKWNEDPDNPDVVAFAHRR
jgi:REP element-mobilizing transposase RayT